MLKEGGTLVVMWWLAHGEQDAPATTEWLSSHELGHLESIRFTKRRNEYITRRWTTKLAIASALDLDRAPHALARIEIRHRASGAPFVEIDRAPASIDVSMSDRSGWAVCLVGPPGTMASGTVGVDLEVVEPRTARFVTDYFTKAEREYVRDLPVESHDEAANLIWSAKEAALKVQQVGLRVDTRTVEVDLHNDRRVDGWSAMTVTGKDGPMPGWWRRAGVFVLTIAFADPAEPPQLLPNSGDLETAIPQHSWVESPRC